MIRWLVSLLVLVGCSFEPAITPLALCGDDAPPVALACPSGRCLAAGVGQSNQVGKAYAADLTVHPELAEPYEAVPFAQWIATSPSNPIVWKSRPFEPLQPRVVPMGGTLAGAMGAELSLGRELDAAFPGQWWEAKIAIGGTGAHDHWAVDSSFPTAGNNLHAQWFAFLDAAIAASGTELRLLDISQGEYDTNALDDAQAWRPTWESIIAAVRARYGSQVVVVVHHLNVEAVTGPHKTIVRDQQAALVAADPLAALANGDLPRIDNLHLTADGCDEAGRRGAAAAIPLMGGP